MWCFFSIFICFLPQWHSEPEGAAFSELTVDPDAAAVNLDGELTESQSQPGPHLCIQVLNHNELIED